MKHPEATPAAETPSPHVLVVYRTVLPDLMRSRALWLFIAVYLLALILYIPAGGNGYGLLTLLIYMLYYVLIALLVLPLTVGAPPAAWEEETDATRARLWVQLVVIAFFLVLYAALTIAIFSPGSVPGLSPWLLQHSELIVPMAVAGIEVVCLLPLVILHLLWVHWREMGWGRGYHSWRVAAIGCSVPVCVLVVFFALGHFTLPALGIALGKAFSSLPSPKRCCFVGYS